jgi:hypothetical protein
MTFDNNKEAADKQAKEQKERAEMDAKNKAEHGTAAK